VLGYSRVPYAAAVDGISLKYFQSCIRQKTFLTLSLIFLCALGFIFSLFMKLSQVISSILAMRILIQFIAQGVGVILLRNRFGKKDLPFKMFLFPIPVIISIGIWLFLFVSTGWFAIWGTLIAIAGLVVFFIFSKFKRKKETINFDFEKN
jgi:amino acid transporter